MKTCCKLTFTFKVVLFRNRDKDVRVSTRKQVVDLRAKAHADFERGNYGDACANFHMAIELEKVSRNDPKVLADMLHLKSLSYFRMKR